MTHSSTPTRIGQQPQPLHQRKSRHVLRSRRLDQADGGRLTTHRSSGGARRLGKVTPFNRSFDAFVTARPALLAPPRPADSHGHRDFETPLDPKGQLVWISRALPGRTHDLTAARNHRIVKTCVRLRVPALADMAYTGAGGTFAVPTRRPPRKELSVGQRSLNRAHARLRYPVERGVATVKRWRIFHHARCSPNWLTSAAKAVLTLELQR
ncbi:hypothetical protein C2142_26800 [Streptomyces sp. CB01881]|nr:hypothetical protein C2142_26800 [Streptomyces sp. CB01881]